MPAADAAHRRPIVVVVAWLLVLQAFLAGVAAAQAAARSAHGAAHASVALICHSTDSNDAGTPADGAPEHDCCAGCLSAAPALVLPGGAPAPVAGAADRALVWTPYTFIVARWAVRSGPSQAPPPRA